MNYTYEIRTIVAEELEAKRIGQLRSNIKNRGKRMKYRGNSQNIKRRIK